MHAQSPALKRQYALATTVAGDTGAMEAAQKLRYEVFSREYGADLGASGGIDRDRFDPHCRHILVTDQASGAVIATTRILLGSDAARIGGFYSEDEFDLQRLKANPGVFAEMGRTCVHEDYRSSAALGMLWGGIARLMQEQQVNYIIGCASISMLDGGRKAWQVAERLQSEFMAEERFHTRPRRTLPHLASHDRSAPNVDIPPLIKAYMRLGARVCGPPCWDPSFRCADLLVLLEVEHLASSYVRRFMRQ